MLGFPWESLICYSNLTILLQATHYETYICGVMFVVWATMCLDGRSALKIIITSPPPIWTHVTASGILYTKQQVLSVQLLLEMKQWFAWPNPHCAGPTSCQLCELYFLNDLYFPRKCLLCFHSMNQALINWSIDQAIDGSIGSKSFGWIKKSYIFTKLLEITSVD